LGLKITSVESKALFSVDGQKIEGINTKDLIQIQKSDLSHMKLDLPNNPYFEVLKKKLNYGKRD
jgi:NAD kinase